jgi:homoserine kinase
VSTASASRVLTADEARRALEGVEIVVPASIANLGPGFDALAVAVQLYLRVRLRGVDPSARNDVRTHLVHEPLEGECYIARSVQTLAARDQLDYPALDLEVASDIPMQAGLGSSAAATVAGLRLYAALSGRTDVDVLTDGSALEGHPDNIAAAWLGGLAAGCVCDDGRVLGLSTPWPEDLRIVTATPQAQVKTPEARVVLPGQIARADAAFNMQRATLLMQALAARRFDLLREALRDRWHQPFRAALVPGLAEALALEHPDLLGVCLSGSGPTIAALCTGDPAGVEAALRRIYDRLGIPCRIRVLAAHNPPPETES